MTDPTAPTPAEPDHVHPDVELASAHLDGEASAEERARVQSDAELQAHVEALAAVVEEVRDVPPPPPGSVDDHVAAALAELDAAPAGAGGGVTPLVRPGRDRPWWQRAPLGAVAAVVLVAALLGVVGLASLAGDDDTDTAATALDDGGDAAEESADEGDDAVDDEALLPESSTTFDAGSAGSDGAADAERPEFASYDELADQLDAELSASGDAAPDDQDETTEDATTTDAEGEELRAAADDPCDAVALLGLDPASVDAVLLAVVAGEPVTAVVHRSDDGSQLVVVADATCEVVLDRRL